MTRKTAFAALAALTASACATLPDQPAAVPLGSFLGVLHTIDVHVDDQPATMIFDTGGGITAITPDLAERIGCQPWGQITGFQLTGDKLTGTRCTDVALSLTGETLGAQDVGVFDLSALLPPGAPKIDGLFSLDALADSSFTLELEQSRLTLETPASLADRIAGASEIPIRFTRQAGGASLTIMARVPTDSGDLWMQLDAGSDAPLQIAPSSATAMGLDPTQPTQSARLTLTGVNGDPISQPTDLRIRDMIIDGNIGIPILRTWVITIDMPAARLWIRRAEGR